MRAFLAVAFCLAAGPVLAWGPTTHELVTWRAIDTLPKGLKPFYQRHRLEIPSLSLEAVPKEEGADRRFAVDRLLPFPFVELPRNEPAFVARFGETPEAGRLPWLIQESYERLVAAFKSQDKGRILGESDTLAGLVTDLRNPMILTENSDGQKTGQHGLYVRFSVKLPEAMGQRLKLEPDAARYLEEPKDYVFSALGGTYVWLDNLLYAEELARRGQQGYTQLYFEAFELKAGPMLRSLLSLAAQDVGSYWYTAWTKAGRPSLQ